MSHFIFTEADEKRQQEDAYREMCRWKYRPVSWEQQLSSASRPKCLLTQDDMDRIDREVRAEYGQNK